MVCTNESLPIATTCGEAFTPEMSSDLAFFVFKRFGRNISSATAAWRRMLENNCYQTTFARLVRESQHYDALAADEESASWLNHLKPDEIPTCQVRSTFRKTESR
jgi:hypothetical protein